MEIAPAEVVLSSALPAIPRPPQTILEALLERLRPAATEPHPEAAPALKRVALSLDEASLIYEKLHRAAAQPPGQLRFKAPPNEPRTDPAGMLERLDSRLRKLPSTGSESARVILEVGPHEAAYLHRILQNDKRDAARRTRIEERIFAPWEEHPEGDEAAEEAEEIPRGGRRIMAPLGGSEPEAGACRTEVRHAISGLPPELARLVEPLAAGGGNASEAARLLGQPRRKTARQVARLRACLKRAGLDL